MSIFAWLTRNSVIVLDALDALESGFIGLDPWTPPQNASMDDREKKEQILLVSFFLARVWVREARYFIVSVLETDGFTGSCFNGVSNVDNQSSPCLGDALVRHTKMSNCTAIMESFTLGNARSQAKSDLFNRLPRLPIFG